MNTWDWMLLAAVLVGAGFALAHLLKRKKAAAAETVTRAAAAAKENNETGGCFGVCPFFVGTGTVLPRET